MQRFLLFIGDNYYPGGGWNDFHSSSDDIDGLKAIAEMQVGNVVPGSADWAQIVDTSAIGTGVEEALRFSARYRYWQ